MRKSIILAAAAVSVAVAAISLVPSPGRAYNVNCPNMTAQQCAAMNGNGTGTTGTSQTSTQTNQASNTPSTTSATTTLTAAQMQAEIVQLQQEVAALQAQVGQGATVRAANSTKSNTPINAPAGGAQANTAGLSGWGN